ncbi:Uncharacterised protein [Mycobacteroides abscessus subsp. massiliense]|nr:hypothetical protein [Mycobacteroides abscessus]SKM18444.1 Uncharacterised protein [Mycobacteroides abscessus subsp. massiliense]MDM2426896.1 hypothetical protein [Mycobacteroides abscessus]MDM2431774.1 hypothetical protein [Mycobacteroides abscessus]MDM2436613.1 hypothetical protein [Mycobacteroides abscessus]
MSKPRKEIPPPLKIDGKSEAPLWEMYLPFTLVDAPRAFLNILALHSKMPEPYRELISAWILEYQKSVALYIAEHYGVEGIVVADAIAREVTKAFVEAIKEGYEQVEGELFTRLEDEMRNDGGIAE